MGRLTHHPAVPMNSLWKNGHLEVPLPWSLHIKHCLTHPDSSRSSSHTNPFTHPLINCPIIIPNIYPMIFPSSSHHDPMVFSYIYIYLSNGFFPSLSHVYLIFDPSSTPIFVPGAPPRPHGNLQALAAEKAAVETNPEEIELDMDSGRRPGAGCKIRWVNHGLIIGSYISG